MRRTRVQEAEETMSTFYNLSDQVHLKATIKPEDRVGLWMGVRSRAGLWVSPPSCM